MKCGKSGIVLWADQIWWHLVRNCGCTPFNDLSGGRFGRWIVVRKDQTAFKNGIRHWLCKTDDSDELISVMGTSLTGRDTLGPNPIRNRKLPPPGTKFGYLKVLRYEGREQGTVVCECEAPNCGKIKAFPTYWLLRGLVSSCGCRQNDHFHHLDTIRPGDVFGDLTVVEAPLMRNGRWATDARCKCRCGREVIVPFRDLINRCKRSCCIGHRSLDPYSGSVKPGDKFNKLTILEIIENERDKEGRRLAKCKCDCGKIKTIPLYQVRTGTVKSCGCLKGDYTLDERRLNLIYGGMKQRCYNPKCAGYPDYGGRGIYICDEWLKDRREFMRWALSHGYAKNLSIDRIDNHGPYAPWNCRWITLAEQQRSGRRGLRYVTVNGLKLILSVWAEKIGMPYGTLFSRFSYLRSIMSSDNIAAEMAVRNSLEQYGKTVKDGKVVSVG